MIKKFLTTTSLLAVCTLGSTATAQVLMLDFGPTTALSPTKSPYHTVNTTFTDTNWNTLSNVDPTSALLFSDGTTSTAMLNLGATTAGSTTVNLSTDPSSTSALGASYPAGNLSIYANTSVGRDGIFNTANTATGFQVRGLDAGTYDIYVVSRNTSTSSATAYTETIRVGTSSTSGNFDFSSYSSKALTYSGVSTSTVWQEDVHYVKFSFTLASGEYLNVAVSGTGSETRGFINAVQIVSTIPEPASVALLSGFGVLGLVAARRRRHS